MRSQFKKTEETVEVYGEYTSEVNQKLNSFIKKKKKKIQKLYSNIQPCYTVKQTYINLVSHMSKANSQGETVAQHKKVQTVKQLFFWYG